MKIAFLAVLLSVMQASVPIPGQATNHPSQHGDNTDQQPNTKNSPTIKAVPKINNNPPASNENKGQTIAFGDTEQTIGISKLPPVTVTPSKRDWADWGIWAFNGLLVVVGGLQVWLLLRTFGAINRQADLMETQTGILQQSVAAAQKGADAAFVNAESVVAIERAWVDVYLENKGPSVYSMQVTNCGRTVAKITGWIVYPKFFETTTKLPEAKELFESSRVVRHSKFLPPSVPWVAEHFNLIAEVGDETFQKMRSKATNVAYWGILQYDDMADKPHTTHFCYWFNSAIGALERVQAPEYNEHT